MNENRIKVCGYMLDCSKIEYDPTDMKIIIKITNGWSYLKFILDTLNKLQKESKEMTYNEFLKLKEEIDKKQKSNPFDNVR